MVLATYFMAVTDLKMFEYYLIHPQFCNLPFQQHECIIPQGIIFLAFCVFQAFMSPRYPGGPRGPVRMPGQVDFNVSNSINFFTSNQNI